jgi:hypothetical protein
MKLNKNKQNDKYVVELVKQWISEFIGKYKYQGLLKTKIWELFNLKQPTSAEFNPVILKN